MSKVDQESILSGWVTLNMTKESVLLAIDCPPERDGPNVESNAWRYWKNRVSSMLVHFEGGNVVRIQD